MGISHDIRLAIMERFQDCDFTSADFPEIEKKYKIMPYDVNRAIVKMADRDQLFIIGKRAIEKSRPRTVYRLNPNVQFIREPKAYNQPKSRAKEPENQSMREFKKEAACKSLWDAFGMPTIESIKSIYSSFPSRMIEVN